MSLVPFISVILTEEGYCLRTVRMREVMSFVQDHTAIVWVCLALDQGLPGLKALFF